MLSLLVRQDQGALAAPDNITPNFTDPQNRNTLIYAVAGVCVSATTIFVFARTYTRFFIIKHRGWQDYVLLVAWLVSTVYIVMMPIGIKYGAGIHQWNVTKAQYVQFSQRANITSIFYSPVMCLLKLAILIQLANIFAPVRSGIYWIICTLSILTIMFYVVCMTFRILECIPREKIWNPSVPGRCIDSAAGILSSAVLNAISDFILLILPLSRIWQLQMPLRRKWQVSAVFATGFLGCLSSIMRLVASIELLKTGDETYGLITVGLWGDAEITTGIICCCLPVLPRLYRKHVSSFVTSLRTRLRSYTASAPGNDGGLSGGSSGKNASSNKVDGPFPRNRSNYVELNESVGKKDHRVHVDGVDPGWV